MASPETVQVTGPGSLRGTIDTAAWPLDSCRAQVLVQLEDGTSVLVPREALVRQEDGSYHLILDPATLERRDASGEVRESPLVVPVIQEVLDVHTSPVETGRVRIRKSCARAARRSSTRRSGATRSLSSVSPSTVLLKDRSRCAPRRRR